VTIWRHIVAEIAQRNSAPDAARHSFVELIFLRMSRAECTKRSRHTRESGYPVITGGRKIPNGLAYWIIRFRG
jgi:hypothetical protein